ncbi:MAG: glycosyltransferase, partial [Acidimicrobiales bacterium]
MPVYDDLHATRTCLESLIRSRTANEVQLDVVVVEDSTPNPLIREYLEGLVLDGQITLYRTPSNLGFTGACNVALAEIDTDVILLNSDTAVFNDWADRLMFAAHVHERIATVTATTNNGSICTIPNPVDSRGISSAIQAEVIDDQLSRIGNRIDFIRPIPTAVGHCVYIKQNVLQEVGLLDDLEFNRGYGEEVDFSLRATSRGYLHVQAGAVYVWHQGGASFGKQKQIREFDADRKLLTLYPFYYSMVARFVETFPNISELYSAAATALRSELGRCRLFISHDLGGGADQVVIDRAMQMIQDGFTPLILRLSISGGFTLEKRTSEEPPTVLLATPHANQADLAGFVANLDVEMIEIHEAVFRLHDLIELLHVWPFPYQVMVHDYYYICPQINLTTSTGEYCGEPGPSECFRCLTERPRPDGTDIVAFRRRSERLLTGAQRITSPSIDTSARVSKYFPKLRIEVEPHHEAKTERKSLERWRDAWPTDKRLRVATIGVVALHKGGARLRHLITLANSLQLPIDFYVIGPTIEEFSDIPSTGAYRPDELPTLAHLADPDVLLFLSDFPETFSFTFSEAVKLDRPIIAPNWGAFTERAREARRCTLFDRASTPLQLLEILITFARTDFESASVRQPAEDTSSVASEIDTPLPSKSTKHRTRPDKLRIALFAEGTPLYPTASAEIRFLRPLSHPALRDAIEITTHSALAPDHVEADIFILQRVAAGKVSLFERMVQDAQRAKAKLIWDIDDALFLISEDHPEFEYYGRHAELLSVLESSVDAITVSTAALENELLTRSTRPVIRYPNFIDEQLIRTFAEVRPSWYRRFSNSDTKTVKAVYMGTPTHEGDLTSGLREFAQRGLGRQECLEIVGAVAGFDESPNLYAQYINALNYEEFMLRFVNSRRWQVGIAPLRDNEFNRYKSAIKY